jgi:hypothetical protein
MEQNHTTIRGSIWVGGKGLFAHRQRVTNSNVNLQLQSRAEHGICFHPKEVVSHRKSHTYSVKRFPWNKTQFTPSVLHKNLQQLPKALKALSRCLEIRPSIERAEKQHVFPKLKRCAHLRRHTDVWAKRQAPKLNISWICRVSYYVCSCLVAKGVLHLNVCSIEIWSCKTCQDDGWSRMSKV